MKKIFIDTDIILDLLTKREPFYNNASLLFSLIDKGKIKAFSSSLIFSNLYYILRKVKGSKQTIKILQKLSTLIEILSVDSKIITLSLQSEFKDFEDAIQYYTAIENNVPVIITRNVKDFKPAKIKILTPDEFLSSL